MGVGRELFITGKDWKACYLQEPESKEDKDQVLVDLVIEVEIRGDCLQKGDIIDIDVISHSSAVELFEVESMTDQAVNLIYTGGAS